MTNAYLHHFMEKHLIFSQFVKDQLQFTLQLFKTNWAGRKVALNFKTR